MPKISALPAASSVAGADLGVSVQGGVTKKFTFSLVLSYVQSNITVTDSNFSGQLSLAHGGTNASLTAANGAIPYSTASAFALLAPGSAGQLLTSNGAAAPSWSSASFPVVGGPAGNILISNGTNYVASTSLWPNTVGSAGKILRSDGTTNAYSTTTFADTYAVNTILYGSGANAVSGLATGNNGALVTSAGGVPSISTVLPAGMTMASDPSTALGIATKQYVDNTALNGTSVYAASAATLGTVLQVGTGVGATLTNAGVQATFALDGINPPVGSNVLIKDTATGMTAANEGIYIVTNAGSGATNWILTRDTDYDTPTEINNTGIIVVQNGNTLAGTGWYNANTIVAVDVTSFNFLKFGAQGTVTSVATNNGVTGGTITSTGTIGLASIATLTGLVNTTGGSTFPSSTTLTAWIDAAIGSAQGDILYRNASSWVVLAPGTSGQVLQTQGAAANPVWATSSGALSGRLIGIQVFTSTGANTYTPSAGVNNAFVELWAAGGGGSTTNTNTWGSGGGAGAYSAGFVAVSGAVTISIGTGGSGQLANNGTASTNGGNTTYNSTTLIAAGGSGSNSAGAGGAGGTAAASTGTIKIAGGQGNQYINSSAPIPGGGSSPKNTPVPANATIPQNAPDNSGGGGGGGDNVNNASNGGSGYAVVWEYS